MLEKIKKFRVPRIFRNKDIDLNDLLINEKEVPDNVTSLREQYAQDALILFLPFRDNIDLLSREDKTYWSAFWIDKRDKMWNEGFQILQNMQDIFNLKNMTKPKDKLLTSTTFRSKEKEGFQEDKNCDDDVIEIWV